MARNATNSTLHKAKCSKSDEFYTLLDDIEKELAFYKDCFRGKTVYCNCDNPAESNFFKYFFKNFRVLGLKKLIASFYIPNTQDLFNESEPEHGGYIECSLDDIATNIADLPCNKFNGDGDFRSKECVSLLKKADIVVTNPPFSLFREHLSQITRYGKDFLVIGNINAITYQEVFNLIQTNKAWLGVHLGRGISGFKVPDHYKMYGSETHIAENGDRIISPNNCLWLTNLDIQTRHNLLKLTKVYEGNEDLYPKFDNFDGINVNKTQDIGSVSVSVSEGVCLRSDATKLIENFEIHIIIANFVLQPDEETGSAEEQPASNMAAPILIAERHRESSFEATPFAIRKAHRLRKPNLVSQGTRFCQR